MRPSRLAFVALTLALAGCCGYRVADCARQARAFDPPVERALVYVDAQDSLTGDSWWFVIMEPLGFTLFDANRKAERVTFRSDIATMPNLGLTVAGHELGHVLGLEHSVEEGAWMRAVHGKDEGLIPGPSETELALASDRSFTLRLAPSITTALEEVIKRAVAAWNRGLRRRAFVVER